VDNGVLSAPCGSLRLAVHAGHAQEVRYQLLHAVRDTDKQEKTHTYKCWCFSFVQGAQTILTATLQGASNFPQSRERYLSVTGQHVEVPHQDPQPVVDLIGSVCAGRSVGVQ
jgi:hypothetical protein